MSEATAEGHTDRGGGPVIAQGRRYPLALSLALICAAALPSAAAASPSGPALPPAGSIGMAALGAQAPPTVAPLTLSLEGSGNNPDEGDAFDYIARITNTGPQTEAMALELRLPDNYELDDILPLGCLPLPLPQTIACAIAPVAQGEVRELRISGHFGRDGDALAAATLRAGTAPAPDGAQTPLTTPAPAPAPLAATTHSVGVNDDSGSSGGGDGGDGGDDGDDGVGAATCFGVPATQRGTGGDDTLVGTDGVDSITGGGGDDTITGLEGNDFLCGEEGLDTIDGEGEDTTSMNAASLPARLRAALELDDRDDMIDGGPDRDFIDGDDVDTGSGGEDTIIGGAGDDDITGDSVTGGGSGATDDIDGGAGNDFIDGDNVGGGDGANDIINGGAGNDDIDGDVVFGGGAEGNDTITGGTGADQLRGQGGDDILNAADGEADTLIDGGDGTDTCTTDPTLDPPTQNCEPSTLSAPQSLSIEEDCDSLPDLLEELVEPTGPETEEEEAEECDEDEDGEQSEDPADCDEEQSDEEPQSGEEEDGESGDGKPGEEQDEGDDEEADDQQGSDDADPTDSDDAEQPADDDENGQESESAQADEPSDCSSAQDEPEAGADAG